MKKVLGNILDTEKTILKNSRGGKNEKVYCKADGVLKLFDKSGKLLREIKM